MLADDEECEEELETLDPAAQAALVGHIEHCSYRNACKLIATHSISLFDRR
jgi:hypothetical protein